MTRHNTTAIACSDCGRARGPRYDLSIKFAALEASAFSALDASYSQLPGIPVLVAAQDATRLLELWISQLPTLAHLP